MPAGSFWEFYLCRLCPRSFSTFKNHFPFIITATDTPKEDQSLKGYSHHSILLFYLLNNNKYLLGAVFVADAESRH